MKRFLLLCSLAGLNLFGAPPQAITSESWNLAQIYEASTHVFYGELTKILPEADFKTGVTGVHIHDIDEQELPLEAITWAKAKELTFSVEEGFKGPLSPSLAVYFPDSDPNIWAYIQGAGGDIFLAKPQAPDDILAKLTPGDQGLFFIRYYWGSKLPVIYQARLGQLALDDLAMLRAHKAAAGKRPLQAILEQAEQEQKVAAARQAAQIRQFEDDYYKILRIQELEIRRSLLLDLMTRMGLKGRWSFFEFKERYLEKYGAYIAENEVPSTPIDGIEKLWHDISGELSKIDFILQARASER
ncbi:hypothetical protein QEH59_13100 [Coraliomargarita sp. SDUM461004]|uniref:Uncharacterized protein n=1 Tax=Thalassobacterium sedimentorum TaxID=3041258 RepID=A0ABU1AP28_9BACT|nr:hypothetical protein [Coraliomargarita sp. SDUM461004]MDQ8195368.1 hypothetical protein [Coraliomargarita sp. SDUM461004]